MVVVPGGAMRFNEDGNRTIGIALLLSVALHGLLLFALAGLREAQQSRSLAREPIAARLTQPQKEPVPVPIPPRALPETRKSVAAPAAKPSSKAGPAPETAPIPPPQAASAERSTSTVAAATLAPAASAVVPSTPVAANPVAKVEPQRVAPASDAPDAGTLAQYRLAIISAAKLYKRYPRAALDNNWQGKVEIRMAIGANGAISNLSVRTSTGHQALDQQALEMIERAKAMAQIPPALRGREFVVDIPVIFSLREPDA